MTLAQFIFSTRENLGLSQKGLANKSHVDISVIEAIESGQELFLATSIRQKLAKGLRVDPKVIKALEKQYDNAALVPEDYIEELRLRIFGGHLTGNICPVCKSELSCRIELMYDLKDNPIRHPKARCTKCPFQIK